MQAMSVREINASTARIDGEERAAVVPALCGLLASTWLLYQKTLFYHWNVTGPHFFALHKVFEDQYAELQKAADTLAEHIRALGYCAPGTPSEFITLSAVEEDHALPSTARLMAENLLKGHAVCSTEAGRAHTLAEKAGDLPTTDLMIRRMRVHDKAAWMLRAFLS
jgi:starvation-inducible DNA-binding protein